MFKSPVRKLARFFEQSRDGWKEKCQAARVESKRWANQARAVAKSRDAWRGKAEAASCELEALKAELAGEQKNVPG